MSKEVPSFTTCSECGKKKFARREVIQSRLLKNNIESWICRECKKSEPRVSKKLVKKIIKEIKEEPILINEEDNEEDEDFLAKQ